MTEKLSPAGVALAFDLGRSHHQMLGVAALAADPATRDASDDRLVGHVEVDHAQFARALEPLVQGLGLGHRAREAIEQITALAVRSTHAL